MKDLIKDHIADFGVEPVIIGRLFYDVSNLFNAILRSIEEGKPYNEYEQLSDSDKKLYDEGLLLF